MALFNKPDSKAEFDLNFKSIKPLMNRTEAYYESSRCLFCHDAPCIQACPTAIDIPLFIRQINTNNLSGASNTIYRSNWLGNICGQVCPTEVLCEGACVYNHQHVKPIEIGRLQSYATSDALKRNQVISGKATKQSRSVAVIGAGPAGISAACELSYLGYSVEIFEARSHPSGLAMHGVAPYKISNEEVLKEIAYLQNQFDFSIKYQSPIRTKEDLISLEERFEVVFLAIGLGNTRSISLKGEDLPGSWGAVEFIETLKTSQHRLKIPDTVVILGAGNTAMDAASECARMGAVNTTLAYRGGFNDMKAYNFEYELVKGTGVQSLWWASPLEIMGSSKVEAVKFVRTDKNNGALRTIPGSEFIVPCEMVIRATGQNNQSELLSQIEGLEIEPDGRPKPGATPFQTTNPRYFTAGDVYNGGLEVVNAVAEAKQAVYSIDDYLRRNPDHG